MPHVPYDGDVAHRKGFALIDNPYPDHTREYSSWRSDWLFRHEHAPHGAADAEGGRLRPTKLNRAEGLRD